MTSQRLGAAEGGAGLQPATRASGGRLSPTSRASAGQLDLRYSIEQFYFDDEPDSRLYLRRIEEAVLESAGRPAAAATRDDGGGAGRALDVACGTGAQMVRLQALGWRACGVDASDEMLRLGQYVSREVLACDRSLRSVGEVLPFRDGSFGLVVCQGSMDHFAHPQLFMAESARVLAPGGRLVVALANYDSLSCLWGRHKSALLRYFNPRIPDDGYWKTPFDHTFKGTYLYLRRLGHPTLVRRRLYGVSLFQFLSPWRKVLGALPPQRAWHLWRAVDRLARRLPAVADTVVAEWERLPQPAAGRGR